MMVGSTPRWRASRSATATACRSRADAASSRHDPVVAMNSSAPAPGSGMDAGAPRHVGRVSQARVQHLDDPVRPPAGHRRAAVPVGRGRHVGHDVGLVGSVQPGAIEQRAELAGPRRVGHLLEGRHVWPQGAQSLIQQAGGPARLLMFIFCIIRYQLV
jgi:hypothetical protein